MGKPKHDWTISGTATSLQFFLNPFLVPKVFYFLEAKFYENYLTSDFH